MTKTKMFITALVAAGLMFGVHSARAHCDSLDGPVAKVVQKALEDGNVNPVLAYAPAASETEIRTAFEKSRQVRGPSADARAIADQAFMETVIRLHRAGEGAAYTGLKPAGADYGPVITAAENTVETVDMAKLKDILVEKCRMLGNVSAPSLALSRSPNCCARRRTERVRSTMSTNTVNRL